MASDPIRRWADKHAALCIAMMAARASGDEASVSNGTFPKMMAARASGDAAAYAAATAAVADHAAAHPGHRRHPGHRCAWCAGPLPDDATGRYCCGVCARLESAS